MNDKRNILEVIERRRWHVRGQVQGVGFRPFVYRAAVECGLTGFVLNDSQGVVIETQGPVENLERFETMLREELPALARIDFLEYKSIASLEIEDVFVILSSDSSVLPTAVVTVDTAVCGDCLDELMDGADRRHGYGLINCTNCGPRYSIIRRVPYDRPNTTMAGFAMCGECGVEYEDPGDRRFHAQPIACHGCGPVVEFAGSDGKGLEGDPYERAGKLLMEGKVVAIKGLGGFHLAVRADSEESVARLRELKKRDWKPFALMCGDMEAAERLVKLSDKARDMMLSPACPIVLAGKRDDAKVAASVAPGNHRLGIMLAYTPVHHLLFEKLRELDGTLGALVMTSGNQSDEPLAIDNEQAVKRLGGMCDGFLWHDRPIERCVDDSVLIDLPGRSPLPLRRARGFVPQPIRLPVEASGDGICVGGELKTTVAVVRGGEAILSHHIGKLTHPLAYEAYQKSIDDLCDMFSISPKWIAHDMHPAYLSSGYAQKLAKRYGAEMIAVQHHHAHAASVMAEAKINGEVLAVVCDGVGYGLNGEIWGGELLKCDLKGFERLASLKPMKLAGGDAAAKDTRRCAMGLLYQVYGQAVGDMEITRHIVEDDQERLMLLQMLEKDVNCVSSSAAGRVFDAMAAMLGLCTTNHFEAQAAMALEAKSADVLEQDTDGPYYALEGSEMVMIHFAPLVKLMLERMTMNVNVGELAALFHDQMALAWDEVVGDAAKRTGLDTVALSGGVFCNERLTVTLMERLMKRGLKVLRHEIVPPNDGGLALGQAAVGAVKAGKG